MQEQKSGQHREWLPADARKAHGCAICAAALPAQKREKNFLKKFKKMLDKWCRNPYLMEHRLRCTPHGGIAQLARAFGSYPKCHRFKSSYRYHQCRVSLKYLGAGCIVTGKLLAVFTKILYLLGPLVKRLRHGPFTAVTWVRFPYKGHQKALALAKAFFFLYFSPRTTHYTTSLAVGIYKVKATPHNSRLGLSSRSGSCGTASALPKCSIMSGCGTRHRASGAKALALCDRCPCFGSLFSATGGAHLPA